MSHVSGLFTRRSYNIDSIAVGVTDNPQVSSMTIVVKGDSNVVEQVKKQLSKLPDVLKITDLAYHESITRELVLCLIEATDENRLEVISICDVFKAKIADMTHTSLLVEYSGNARQVNSFIEIMKRFHIVEMSRTGQIALSYRSEA